MAIDKQTKKQLTMRSLSDFHQGIMRNLHEYLHNFTQSFVAIIPGKKKCQRYRCDLKKLLCM